MPRAARRAGSSSPTAWPSPFLRVPVIGIVAGPGPAELGVRAGDDDGHLTLQVPARELGGQLARESTPGSLQLFRQLDADRGPAVAQDLLHGREELRNAHR